MTRLLKSILVLVAMFRLSAAADESPWQRVVIIGASASSGFVLSEPFGGSNTDKCRLNHYLDAAMVAPHEPLKNLSSAMLFMSPEAIAIKEVDACTNRNPTLVIAVDFLFWFCYGEGRTDADRAQRFEHGLKLLEKIPCPIVVGDIPDASAATNSGIISVAQVPSESARNAANHRLRQWAASHPAATVVSLDAFMSAVKANAAINGKNISVPAGQTYALLQNDRLHPNPTGAALLSLGILDAYVTRYNLPKDSIHWNLEEVRNRGLQAALAKKNTLASNTNY